MKQRITLFVFFGMSLFLLCSYRPGPAHDAGANATGSDGGTAACGGSGCHSNTLTTSLGTTLEFDSLGIPVSSYYPGGSYTITITATNNTGLSLPKFGFQMACVTDASAGTNNTVQAGTWGATLPTNVRNTPTSISGLSTPFIEQSNFLNPLSGSGGAGTVYTETIPWTAPAAGTGAIQIFGTIQAVNATGNQNGDKSEQAAPLSITEATPTNVGIHDPSLVSSLTVFPTVTSGPVNIRNSGALDPMAYHIYGLDGRTYDKGTIAAGINNTILDMSQLSPGIYFLQIESQGQNVTYRFVKE